MMNGLVWQSNCCILWREDVRLDGGDFRHFHRVHDLSECGYLNCTSQLFYESYLDDSDEVYVFFVAGDDTRVILEQLFRRNESSEI